MHSRLRCLGSEPRDAVHTHQSLPLLGSSPLSLTDSLQGVRRCLTRFVSLLPLRPLHPLPSVPSCDRRPFQTLAQPSLDFRALLHRGVRCACSPLPASPRPFLSRALFHFKASLRASPSKRLPLPVGALTPPFQLGRPAYPPVHRPWQQAARRPFKVCPRSGAGDASVWLSTPRGGFPGRPSPSFMLFVTSKSFPRNALLGRPPVARVSCGNIAGGVPTLAARDFKGLAGRVPEAGYTHVGPSEGLSRDQFGTKHL